MHRDAPWYTVRDAPSYIKYQNLITAVTLTK